MESCLISHHMGLFFKDFVFKLGNVVCNYVESKVW